MTVAGVTERLMLQWRRQGHPARVSDPGTSVYDRYSYGKEKMAAVTQLGAYVNRMAKLHRTRRVA
jgi:hypothetical protein